VTFSVLLGALTSTNECTVKLQESDDNSTFTDVTDGTAPVTVDDDDNQVLILEYLRAKKRYVRVHIDRDTANAVVDGILAEIHGLRNSPPTNGATVHSVTQAVGY
jgi:streptomycin 6-kinase